MEGTVTPFYSEGVLQFGECDSKKFNLSGLALNPRRLPKRLSPLTTCTDILVHLVRGMGSGYFSTISPECL